MVFRYQYVLSYCSKRCVKKANYFAVYCFFVLLITYLLVIKSSHPQFSFLYIGKTINQLAIYTD